MLRPTVPREEPPRSAENVATSVADGVRPRTSLKTWLIQRSFDGPDPPTGVDVSGAVPLYHWYELAPVAKAMRIAGDPCAGLLLLGWIEKDGFVQPLGAIEIVTTLLFAT